MDPKDPTLNDLVDDIHHLLVRDERYRAFLHAVYDEQAVEGSLAVDDVMAAEMIREKAKEIGSTEVARQKLATISKALHVVLRRYGLSRKERRDRIRGEIIPSDGA
jgi:hypothetical protein